MRRRFPATLAARFDALRASRELASCSDEEVWSLVGHADDARLPAGSLVAQEGRYCAQFVLVMEGSLRSRQGLLGPGDTVGWDAMWDRLLNPATVTAESDARLLVMSHEQFRAVKSIVPLPERPHVGEQGEQVRIVA